MILYLKIRGLEQVMIALNQYGFGPQAFDENVSNVQTGYNFNYSITCSKILKGLVLDER